MTRDTYDKVCQDIDPIWKRLYDHGGRGRPLRISLQKSMLMCLYYVASACSNIRVADAFGEALNTTHDAIDRILICLRELRKPKIWFPHKNSDEYQMVKARCWKASLGYLHGGTYYIDGTHIPVIAKKEHRRACIGRKGIPTLLVHACTDGDGLFRDVVIGHPARPRIYCQLCYSLFVVLCGVLLYRITN